MKSFCRCFRIFAAALTITLLFSITAVASTGNIRVKLAKKAKKYKVTALAGDKIIIKVPGVSKPKFKSSKKKVAKVSKKGVVTVKKTGKATVTVSYKKKKAKISIKVIKNTPGNQNKRSGTTDQNPTNPGGTSSGFTSDITSLSVDKPTITVSQNSGIFVSQTVKIKVTPAPPVYETITATSSNPSLARVSDSAFCYSDGYVSFPISITTTTPGTATVTFKSTNGKTCSTTITVLNDDKDFVTIDGVTFDLHHFVNSTFDTGNGVYYTVSPFNAFDESKVTVKINDDNNTPIEPQLMTNYYNAIKQYYRKDYDLTPPVAQYYVPKVSNWKDAVAKIEITGQYTTQNSNARQYSIYATPLGKLGSFTIALYYNGKSIRTITVKFTNNPEWKNMRAWIDPIQQEAFELCNVSANDSPSKKYVSIGIWEGLVGYYERLRDAGKGDCITIAYLRAYCALDFGLKAYFHFPYAEIPGHPKLPATIDGGYGPGHIDALVESDPNFTFENGFDAATKEKLIKLQEQYGYMDSNGNMIQPMPHKAKFLPDYPGPGYIGN